MDLTLFVVFLVLSLVIVALGLFRTEHTELSLVGFAFLFILSLVLIGGDIQYKTGINETYTYGCLCCEQGTVIGDEYVRGEPPVGCTNENATIAVIAVNKIDTYETFTAGGPVSHFVGYWLAIMSFVGFLAVIISIRHSFRGEDL